MTIDHYSGHNPAQRTTINDEIHAQAPYASKSKRDTLNSNDNIYNQGGSQLVLPVVKSGSIYAATFDVGFVM